MKWTVFAIILFSMAMPARARFVRFLDADSIELQVAKAKRVFLGEIISTESALPSTRFPVKSPWLKVIVRIHKVLVGPPETEIVYWIRPDERFPTQQAAPPDKSEYLFMLVEGKQYKTSDPTYEDVQWTLEHDPEDSFFASGQVGMGPDLRWLPTMQLDPYKSGEELLAGIRPYCRRPLAVTQIETIWTANDCETMHIPVDEQSLALARQWAGSDQAWKRWLSLRLLKWKPSPVDAEALKQIVYRPTDCESAEVVREAAINLLRSWRVTFSQPVRVPAAPILELNQPRFWISLLGLLAVPCCYFWLMKRGWTSPSLWWRIPVTAWLIAASIVAVIWVRSYSQLDAICGGKWEFGAINGNLYIIDHHRSDVPVDWPWSYCRPADVTMIREVGSERDENWNWPNARIWGWDENLFDFMFRSLLLVDTTPQANMQWTEATAHRLKMWLPAATMCAIALLAWSARLSYCLMTWLRTRLIRGFPVEIVNFPPSNV